MNLKQIDNPVIDDYDWYWSYYNFKHPNHIYFNFNNNFNEFNTNHFIGSVFVYFYYLSCY